MSFIDGLTGTTLVLAICGLLFIEEVGVPLPVAPGDLVLVIGGIAIAGGRLNPLVIVPAAVLSCIAGATLGRELTALLGWERLMKLARPLHAEKPLARAAGMIRRGGWRTVFTARLIPGLRIYTSQMAGITGVPRSTFLTGLIPAAAAYVVVFVGLGAAFGRPVLAVIHQSTNKLTVVLLVAVVLLPAILGFRIVLRRTLMGLELAGWTGPLRLRLDPVQLALLPLCLGLNLAGHGLVVALKLPLFADSAGTILAGILAGPWVGGSVGVLSNLLTSNTFDPIAAPYAIVSFALGFTAGLGRYLRWQSRPSRWLLLWIVCVMVSSLLSTPINFVVGDGQSGVGLGDAVYAALSARLPRAAAAFIGEIAVDLPDKLISVTIALAVAFAFFRQPRTAAAGIVDLDLKPPFTFVFRSPRWKRRLFAAVLCFAFAWLIVPALLLLGYLVELSRSVRDGSAQLPGWDGRWAKIKNGFAVAALFVIWSLPGIAISLVSSVLSGVSTEVGPGGVAGTLGDVFSAVANAWEFLVLVIQVPVWAQYLKGGFRAALRPGAIFDRLKFNFSLTVVVAALTVILLFIGAIGVVGIVIGIAVTLAYMSCVWAHLAGDYARLTDSAVLAK